MAGHFIAGYPDIEASAFDHERLTQESCKRVLQFSLWALEPLAEWNKALLTERLQWLSSAMELKFRDLLFPLFIAVMGSAASSSVLTGMEILGPDLSRARLRRGVALLGGVSKKDAKRWAKDYQALNPS